MTASAFPLIAGYFGETIFHPGATIGTEWIVAGNRVHHLFVEPDVGFYVHPQHHTGVFSRVSLGYRITAAFGLGGELILGAGYLHTFLGGTAYDSSAKVVADFGRPSFMPSASIGISLRLRQGPASIEDVAVFLRLTVFGQYPFNGALLPHGAVQLGVRF